MFARLWPLITILLLAACNTTQSGQRTSSAAVSPPYKPLLRYVAEDGIGPSENAAYFALRCASAYTNLGALVKAGVLSDSRDAEAIDDKAVAWIGMARRMKAQAAGVEEETIAATVREDFAKVNKQVRDYVLLESPEGSGEFPGVATLNQDLETCAAFNVSG
jgi:hypothetical protein